MVPGFDPGLSLAYYNEQATERLFADFEDFESFHLSFYVIVQDIDQTIQYIYETKLLEIHNHSAFLAFCEYLNFWIIFEGFSQCMTLIPTQRTLIFKKSLDEHCLTFAFP